MSTEALTLSQLTEAVSLQVRRTFPESLWLIAETSDVRLNKNGHCYLEFIEKKDTAVVAKARAYIWSNTFRMLKPYFEQQTGQAFVSGIKVLVKVTVDFNPVYGFGLNVVDIDPVYTLGDIQRHQQEILHRLTEEGVIDLNKELMLAALPQRIAIITSPTAAGYEDFLNHLTHNADGYVFYPKLFPAVMQGEQTEQSIIAALEKIYTHQTCFDAVAIIRGGGASSDLASFDSYLLAANCAQFPLPILTGIGHERDDTVLDFIAYHRAKTPTAVADFLIRCMSEQAEQLFERQQQLVLSVTQRMEQAKTELMAIGKNLPLHVFSVLERQSLSLRMYQENLGKAVAHRLSREDEMLQSKANFFRLSSPDYILSKGYSLTMKEGKVVRSVKELQEGDRLQTKLADGEVTSCVQPE